MSSTLKFQLQAAARRMRLALTQIENEIEKLQTELDICPEPESYYDSPGVNTECTRYIDFIVTCAQKKNKTIKDLIYLGVMELNSGYDFIPDNFRVYKSLYTLPSAEYKKLIKQEPRAAEETLKLIQHEFLNTRNYTKISHWLQHIPGLEKNVLANTLRTKVLYIQEKYSAVVPEITKLMNSPEQIRYKDFQFYCLIQRGQAYNKLHQRTSARKDFATARRLGSFMSNQVIIHWHSALLELEVKNYPSALRHLTAITKVKTINFNGRDCKYIKQLASHVQEKIKQ